MSAERSVADCDQSDVSESWADATMGQLPNSDSEDTLSNLSFDGDNPEEFLSISVSVNEPGEPQAHLHPHPIPRNGIRFEINEYEMEGEMELKPGHILNAPSVDFPKSPSQLKITHGPSFMPQEDIGAVSEDESASVSSYGRAQLDLNFQNGDVRLTKKESGRTLNGNGKIGKGNFGSLRGNESFVTTNGNGRTNGKFNGDNEPSSLLHDPSDVLDDYMEDFYLPGSHERVMQRATSFRRKVQLQLESAATENALAELKNLDEILQTYEEEDEGEEMVHEFPAKTSCGKCGIASKGTICSTCINDVNEEGLKWKTNGTNNVNGNHLNGRGKNGVKNGFHINGKVNSGNYRDDRLIIEDGDMTSLLDIDAIIDENAPHLKVLEKKKLSVNEEPMSLQVADDFFLQKETLEKIHSAFDSSNFNNIYTLSGELKDILTVEEIEEIVANKEHLEDIIDPKLMAALSWSLNDPSLAKQNVPNGNYQSNGFERGHPNGDSLRRKIKIDKIEDLDEDDDEDEETPQSKSSILQGLDHLSVEDEINLDSDEDPDGPKMFFVRRDSKRFSKGKGDANRVLEGLFVESKTPMGTFKRIKAPLNISDDMIDDTTPNASLIDISLNDELNDSINELNTDPKGKSPKKQKKKRISVDQNILSAASDLDDSSIAADATESDVFHSILDSLRDEDPTIRTDDGDEDEITLDISTPDELEESIMEQLESLQSDTPEMDRIPEMGAEEELEESRRWKSFRMGEADLQIDLKAINPYRRVLSHGGYFDAEKKVAIILFSGCFLPDRGRREYVYLMEHLFLYVLSTLEELIVEDYILVYLHGATPKSCMPTFSWLKKCYQLIDRRLRKNLKSLYLVHPTFWLKTVVALTKPFISAKFSRKIKFINTLPELCLEIPTEHLVIPDRVLTYDVELKLAEVMKNSDYS